MHINFLDDLNIAQKKAVEKTDGPVLIVAGPGSGKTRVITSRIAYLIQEQGVNPYNIAAVTFTNKAASEMKDRLSSMLGKNAERVTARTFHSFCSMVLRREGGLVGLDTDFVIFDDNDQMETIKKAMKDLDIDPKSFAPRNILSRISNSKSQLIDSEQFISQKSNYYDEVVGRVFESYENTLSQSNAADFDDLLMKTQNLFLNNPDVLNKYQNRFVYLMVDEFQDTNIAQYSIAKQIASTHRNLCVVGDPDQSIYSWRNADIRNILSFRDDFPEATVVPLEENYRSTQTILEGARELISSNKERVEKNLWTRNSKGNLITVAEGYNEEEEAHLVLKEVTRILDSGKHSRGDIAVMYRVNAQSRTFEMACQKYGIPYQVVGGIKFYQRKEIKDITAYLRTLINTDDDISLARIINMPTRGLGQRTIDEIIRIARINELSMFEVIERLTTSEPETGTLGIQLSTRAVKSLEKFRDMITSLRIKIDGDLIDLIDSVVQQTGYSKYLQNDQEQGEERIENIQEYMNSAREYAHMENREGLTSFLESVALVSDIDDLDDSEESLTLITLHQAKGLEFPAVFMVGMEEGLLPHRRAIESGEPSEIEEERRLCYVGMTRAQTLLYMMRAFRRGFRGGTEPSAPSRFLSEIPRDLIQMPGLETANPEKTPTQHRQNSQTNPNKKTKVVKTPKSQNENLSYTRSMKHKSPQRRRRIVNKIDPPESANSYKTGDKVSHGTFGEGIVMSCEASGSDLQVTVAFKSDAGVKKLIASLAKLEKL